MKALGLMPSIGETVWKSLALANAASCASKPIAPPLHTPERRLAAE